MRSMQAPRSERLKREREADSAAVTGVQKNGESSTTTISGQSPSSGRTSTTSPVSAQHHKAHRRLSIDPAPVSATLQTVSPPPFARPVPPNPSTLFSHSHPPTAFKSPSGPGQAGSITAAAHPPTVQGRPKVRCMARTRIPTPHGSLFLHLYHNSSDAKEHLAIVLDPIQLDEEARKAAPRGRKEIRSRTLDEQWREGETAMERVVRGAYVGRLGPGGEEQASEPYREQEPQEEGEGREEDEDDILPMVRIHSECFTGETIGSMRCDCGEQLDEAIRQIASPQRLPQPSASSSSSAPTNGSRTRSVPGRGVVIYMRQEGRGIGLLEKIRAYNLQDLGHDTVAANLMLGHGADERKYDVAAEILRDLGLAPASSSAPAPAAARAAAGAPQGSGIRLLTNNPEKVQGLAREGVYVKERVGMVPRDWKCSGQDDEPHHHASPTGTGDSHASARGEDEGEEKEYEQWRERRAGVGLIGAGKASGGELEKYLRTKVERMGHSEFCRIRMKVLAVAD